MAASGKEPMAETMMDETNDWLGVGQFIAANDAMCNALAGVANAYRELAEKAIGIFIRLHENRFYPKRNGGFHAKRLNRMSIVRSHKQKKAR